MNVRFQSPCALLLLLLSWPSGAESPPAQVSPTRPRARDLGIPLGGQPGPLDAITDVAGVEVGYTTLISGEGARVVGQGPVRTGVTAVLPRGREHLTEPVFAATAVLNGCGEMTGTAWVKESGLLTTPVMITNTNSVGVVRDAVIAWGARRGLALDLGLPVVAETYDGSLNDVDGFHVTAEHAFHALDSARSGPLLEGNVGGGTGMICHAFKGGTGTASRKLPVEQGGYTVGVLVQTNYGIRRLFTVAGVPVGEEISDLQPCYAGPPPASAKSSSTILPCAQSAQRTSEALPKDTGSIIVLVATDAPLLPHQLERMAHRVPLGIGKMGGLGADFSGDLFLAFSTQAVTPAGGSHVAQVSSLDNAQMDPLFEATIQATQEAILNALLAAETQTGADNLRVFALPRDRLLQALRKYNRLPPAEGPPRRTK